MTERDDLLSALKEVRQFVCRDLAPAVHSVPPNSLKDPSELFLPLVDARAKMDALSDRLHERNRTAAETLFQELSDDVNSFCEVLQPERLTEAQTALKQMQQRLLHNFSVVTASFEEQPEWRGGFSESYNNEKKHHKIEVAVGMLADATIEAIKGLLGDFSGLAAMLSSLRQRILNMNWTSEELFERKAAVSHDEGSGKYAFLVIERQSSNKDVEAGGLCSKRKCTVRLQTNIKVMQPSNDTARSICQQLLSAHAGELVRQIDRMKIF